MSIFNPWKAARIAEQEVARLRDILAERDETESNLRRTISELELRFRLADANRKELLITLASAHFRNPKTGRLGRKGERFK
jgi:hypothetical protein